MKLLSKKANMLHCVINFNKIDIRTVTFTEDISENVIYVGRW